MSSRWVHLGVASEFPGRSTVGIPVGLRSHVSEPMKRAVGRAVDRVFRTEWPLALGSDCT